MAFSNPQKSAKIRYIRKKILTANFFNTFLCLLIWRRIKCRSQKDEKALTIADNRGNIVAPFAVNSINVSDMALFDWSFAKLLELAEIRIGIWENPSSPWMRDFIQTSIEELFATREWFLLFVLIRGAQKILRNQHWCGAIFLQLLIFAKNATELRDALPGRMPIGKWRFAMKNYNALLWASTAWDMRWLTSVMFLIDSMLFAVSSIVNNNNTNHGNKQAHLDHQHG